VIDTLKPYDLFFLPSWNENYGHVIVESLASGCPVLLSDQTPWHDLVEYDAGWEFSLNDAEKFAQKIDQLIVKSKVEYALFKKAALQYYVEKIVDHDLEKSYINYFKA
jgi:glycosyltransferase involved in cell wall biosynthesis